METLVRPLWRAASLGLKPRARIAWEGTGTLPDYLANRADKKNEGPVGKKIARKSRISRRLSGGGVGA